MNIYSIIQFFSLLIYIVLIAIVLLHDKTRLQKILLVYLGASTIWSLSSFLTHAEFAGEQSYLWIKVLPFSAVWVFLAYAHFIMVYVRRSTIVMLGIGYTLLAAIAVSIGLGYIPQGVIVLGEYNLFPVYRGWLFVFSIYGFFLITVATVVLLKSYRASHDHEQRNRILYLLIGIGIMVVFGIAYTALPMPKYPIDHIGHMGNAIVMTLVILKYKLLDVKLILKRGLVHSAVTACITAAFLIMLTTLYQIIHEWTTSLHLGAIVVVALLVSLAFNPLRATAERLVNRLFYGKRYDYRKVVLQFAQSMSNVLDLNELVNAMLHPIAQAVQARQVSLLLPDGDDFSTIYGARLVQGEPLMPIKYRKDSVIVTWLAREDKPLPIEVIKTNAEFKALWESDKNALDAADVKLLFPLNIKNRLIGILALSSKQADSLYSADDIDMIMTLAHEAAVVIHNAQLYDQAKQRANTDELTGLFNHRYFHQRLDEEIARCSRFGEVFSLILLDLDLFKNYNDIYGHLAGDDILRQVSQCIKKSTRRIDISFRYGGDEFAILLPQASLGDTRKVAERVTGAIATQTDSKGIPLSCSVGIGSWPSDGVMREELIQVADAALYYAKQTGRNRICCACEVALSQVLRTGSQLRSDSTVLSTIYALAATVDAKDHYTYGHSKKVSEYAVEIAQALGYSEERIASIRAAALLHDIGKIGISDEILRKHGPLTNDDWEPIHAHPNLSVAILKHIDALSDSLAAVQYHHERYDGAGYPNGLHSDNIPLDARILAVADAYDAMTSERPYKTYKMKSEEGLNELKRCAGTQFDPIVVETFINVRKKAKRARDKTSQADSKPDRSLTSTGRG